jgi:hypothetical protein
MVKITLMHTVRGLHDSIESWDSTKPAKKPINEKNQLSCNISISAEILHSLKGQMCDKHHELRPS